MGHSPHGSAATSLSPGGAWSPATPGNLLGWWKADVGTSESGGLLTAWLDQSGNGYHWTINAGNRPAYSASGWVDGLKPGITFVPAGGSDFLYLDGTALSTYINGSNVVVTVAMTLNTPAGSAQEVWLWYNTGIAEGLYGEVDASDHARAEVFFGSSVGGTASAVGTKRLVWVFKSGGTVDIYVDGVLDVNGGASSRVFSVIDRILIGAQWNLGNPFSGILAEFNISGTAWTATDVSNYQTYSTRKWPG